MTVATLPHFRTLAVLLVLAAATLIGPPAAVADFSGTEHSTNAGEGVGDVPGVGTPLVPEDLPLGGAPVHLASADFNSDGQDDLAVTTNTRFGPEVAWSFPSGVVVFVSQPDGTYESTFHLTGSEERSYSPLTEDPSPLDCCPTATIGEYPAGDIHAGDVTADGAVDLVVANEFSNSVSVLINTGTGAFAGPRHSDTKHRPAAVATADVDGDGTVDLLTAGTSLTGDDDALEVLPGSGTGTFGPSTTYPAPSPGDVAVAELDGRNGLDLLVPEDAFNGNTLRVFLNDGDGTYPSHNVTDYQVGDQPMAAATTDLDGDGDADVATANRRSEDVSVLLNDGNGKLSPEADSPYAPPEANDHGDVVLADLNGDGHPDIATSNRESVSVLRHDGNLDDGNTSFNAEANSPYPVGQEAMRSLTAGMFDGDSKRDLATANNDSKSITVLHNQ